MRVLQINKFFNIHGGSEVVLFDTIKGLRERKNVVSEFSMQDPANQPSDYEKYFVSPVILKGKQSIAKKFAVFKRVFRSQEVEYKLGELIKSVHPEVAHLHNVYRELSASTFLTLRQMNVPMVLTLHDVFPLCANHSLLCKETLAIKKLANKPLAGFMNRCVNNSFIQSFAGMLEAYYYKNKKIWEHIDAFVCPSEFIKNLMVEYGFSQNKMRVIRNPFVLSPTYQPLGTKVVYLGRIHYEKGIKVFLKAATQLRDLPIIVAGTGPDDAWANKFITDNKLNNIDRRGWVSGDSWQSVMNEAKVVVVPSVFLENCSLTILEALSSGRIVVASDRGGNPELIVNGKTGFLCKPEDPTDLARAIRQAMTLPDGECKNMIEAGRELVKKNHDPEVYFRELLKVYKSVIV